MGIDNHNVKSFYLRDSNDIWKENIDGKFLCNIATVYKLWNIKIWDKQKRGL